MYMTVFGINLHSILRGACKYITQLSILDLTEDRNEYVSHFNTGSSKAT